MKYIVCKTIKKIVFLSIFVCGVIGITFHADAAPLEKIPYTIEQPDGEKVECFMSGDEFFNYIHDNDGNIIVKNYDTGEYVYAKIQGKALTPGEEIVGQASRKKAYNFNAERIKFSDIPDEYVKNIYESSPLKQDTPIKTTGLDFSGEAHKWKNKKVNNIVIFIDFPDVTFSNQDSAFYEGLFNNNNKSLKRWFDEASYGETQVVSNFYPKSSGTVIAAYRDIHNRSFYEKKPKAGAGSELSYFDENGTEVEQEDLEHPLLKRAIAAVKGAIPGDLNIDADNDGNVDCITFVIAGESCGWNELLWSHKWSLYTEKETINGKKAREYVLVMENELKSRGANVLMHEVFHIYGAPDLYHYNQAEEHHVGNWDIMATSQGQMTSTYMKYKYGGWIDEIPEIETSGTFTLNKSSVKNNNSYVIRTPFSGDEFFVLEFRKKEGYFDENVINGSGLVIYRIDARFHGNSKYDANLVFDEVFVAESAPENRYYPSYEDSVILKLRSGKEAGIAIDNFAVTEDKISFRVQLTSERVARYFKDYRVAQVLANQLNKSMDAITDEDLMKITELTMNPLKKFGLSLNLEGVNKLTNLQKVRISEGARQIGSLAFYGCVNLVRAEIPSSVVQISEDAFKGCDGLTIWGEAGSFAQTFAAERGIPFRVLGSDRGTVRFDANGGRLSGIGSLEVEENGVYGTLPNAVKKGYLFDGWFTERSGGIRITEQSVIKFPWDPVLYAHWSKVSVKRVSLQKPKNLRGRKMKIKWKKVAGAKGYQVRYAANKKLRKPKTKTTSKNAFTVKKLKKGKTYYVKIRAYKLDSMGKKVYGTYSKVRNIKIKK